MPIEFNERLPLLTERPGSSSRSKRQGAFTLIELLVVIAIMAILASMIFPVMTAVNRSKIRNRTQAQLTKIETGIEQYKIKNGHYPPDNPGNWTLNQLYFELMGTTLNNGVYKTLDGSSQIDASAVSNTFVKVGGFVNCTKGGGGDEGGVAQGYLPGLKPDETAQLASGVKVLVGPVAWPKGHPYQPIATDPTVNPWCYNSTNPTNNPNSYDLWIDVIIGSKTNRLCNWSKQPLTVSTLYP